MALTSYFTTFLPAIETETRRIAAPSNDPTLTTFFGMLHYHLGWVDADFKPAQFDSGKRIRPVLTLLCCEASGGDWRIALPAAAAVELLHNFSLIHDDIEDGDPMRRGRPTLWKQWGIAQAINAGDALYTLAHTALNDLIDRGVPANHILAARRSFDRACLVLTQGQHLDLGFESRSSVTAAAYSRMINGKTAALIEAACGLGALVNGSDLAAHYEDFGRELGLAFQIQDDLLGIWGDPQITGKPAGNDLRNHKKSLPVAYGLDRSEDLRRLYAQAEVDVGAVMAELDRVGARAYTERLATQHHRQALEALEATGQDTEATLALEALANQLLKRNA
ncbi:MAG: polyprenyl synthetase family protein [Chloroflexi bacterium]|nr:polyprenyl synthetase family protein [Chloroflexota bacterium]